MAVYVAMEPPFGPGPEDERGTVFVREGFHVLAFLLPVFWLLWHRLWIEAALALALTLGLAALGNAGGMGAAAPLLSLLASIYFGLESPALRLAALRRRGWTEWGAVEAEDIEGAEMRYIVERYPDETVHAETGSEAGRRRPLSPARPAAAVPGFGLLAYPKAR